MMRMDNSEGNGNSGVMRPGVGVPPTAAQYTAAYAPPVSTGTGHAPAPTPVATQVAPAGVNPNLSATPPPSPSLIPISQGIHNPSTGQTTPNVGTPSGYPIGQGVDTSYTGLLPQGFNLGSLTGGTLPDAATPGAQSYVQQGAADQQHMTPWTVAPNQTVQGQFAELMQKGNPAIQAVEEQTLRAHALSGGRNNLMAQSAATLSGAQVGLSIAAQDAQTYAAAGQFNASTANAFAQQMNTFIDNAMLSKQNFDQGVAMLKDQNNQQIQQIFAQVQANAATQSTNLKSTMATLQAQTNATLEQMDKQFSQNVATLNLQNQFATEQDWQHYGMQVRMSYLASINANQNTLMQTIGEIRSNPNITAAQAQGAVQDAIDQFNAHMTMDNAYYGAMVPGATAGQTSGTYGSAAYDYSIA